MSKDIGLVVIKRFCTEGERKKFLKSVKGEYFLWPRTLYLKNPEEHKKFVDTLFSIFKKGSE